MKVSASTRLGLCLLLVSFLLIVAPAAAQQSTGLITGTVQDGQGAVVPAATVTVINAAQGATFRVLETSAEGTFVVTPVPPGVYTVTVEKAGFKKYTKTDVRLAAGERVGLPPIGLELGYIKPEGLNRLLQSRPTEITGEAVNCELVSHACGVRLLLASYLPRDARNIWWIA